MAGKPDDGEDIEIYDEDGDETVSGGAGPQAGAADTVAGAGGADGSPAISSGAAASDDAEQDERLAEGDEAEADKKAKAAEERRAKSRRQRQREARNRTEEKLRVQDETIQKLTFEINRLNQRQDQTDLGTLEQRIAQLRQAETLADQAVAEAMAAGNKADVAKALGISKEAGAKRLQLEGIRDHARASADPRFTNGGQQQRQTQQQQRPQLHPDHQRLGDAWTKANTWFDPSATDMDSRIVAAIDASVEADGYDPRSPDYWEELTERCREKLPHHFTEKPNGKGNGSGNGSGNGGERRGPGVGGGNRNGGTSNARTFHVSAERKAAMIAAGTWDDPKRRIATLREYERYDRENAAAGNGSR